MWPAQPLHPCSLHPQASLSLSSLVGSPATANDEDAQQPWPLAHASARVLPPGRSGACRAGQYRVGYRVTWRVCGGRRRVRGAGQAARAHRARGAARGQRPLQRARVPAHAGARARIAPRAGPAVSRASACCLRRACIFRSLASRQLAWYPWLVEGSLTCLRSVFGFRL